MGNATGSPQVDPMNYIINRTTLVQKDPTLVITSNNLSEKSAEIRVIPGISEGVFILDFPFGGKVDYDVLDVRGRLLQSGSMIRRGEINLSTQPSGQYLLRMLSENGGRTIHRILRR
jgi:hypothetical protein